MITRYRVSFEDRLIEPDSQGKWVKFEDLDAERSAFEAQSLQVANEAGASQQAQISAQSEQIASLTEANEQLGAELKDARNGKDSYGPILKAARDRLKLLGHAPTCGIRYSATNVHGASSVGECSCGLDEWMREASLHG